MSEPQTTASPDKKVVFKCLGLLLAGLVVSAVGGVMFVALYCESLFCAALVALCFALNKSESDKLRRSAQIFLKAFSMCAGAYLIVLVWDFLFVRR